MSPRFFRMIAATAVLMTALADAAHSQVGVVENPRWLLGRTLIFRGDQVFNVREVIYRVPATRRFRVTDLIATNFGTGPCLVLFPDVTNEMLVAAQSTKHFSFLSGPTYQGGQVVEIANGPRLPVDPENCRWSYTVMGYLVRKK